MKRRELFKGFAALILAMNLPLSRLVWEDEPEQLWTCKAWDNLGNVKEGVFRPPETTGPYQIDFDAPSLPGKIVGVVVGYGDTMIGGVAGENTEDIKISYGFIES